MNNDNMNTYTYITDWTLYCAWDKYWLVGILINVNICHVKYVLQ